MAPALYESINLSPQINPNYGFFPSKYALAPSAVKVAAGPYPVYIPIYA